MFLSAQLSNYSDHLTFQYAAVWLRHVNRRLFFFFIYFAGSKSLTLCFSASNKTGCICSRGCGQLPGWLQPQDMHVQAGISSNASTDDAAAPLQSCSLIGRCLLGGNTHAVLPSHGALCHILRLPSQFLKGRTSSKVSTLT